MPRFSANLGFLWPELPLLERIAAAGRAGFKAVELHVPYDVPALETKAACANAGVKLLGINTASGSGPDGHRGLAAVPGREADFEKLFDQAATYAAAAGGTAVHAMAGLVAPSDRAAAAATMAKNLAVAAKKAEALGLTIFLEPLNERDMPGYFYHEVERAVEIIDRVQAPNVKLMFDVYHIGCAQGDVLTRLRKFYGRIGHIQVAAVPSRAEPDEGEINFPVIFRAIDALGYSGWVGAEYKPRGNTDAGLSWVKTLGVSL
jgi:hydroxypyruvate isomerase